jgi:Phospholipase_D-nuclease N-terminal
MEDFKAILIFLAICVPFFIGTIWAVLDVAQKDFGSAGAKAKWWVIASIPFAGFIVYLLAGFRKGKKAA